MLFESIGPKSGAPIGGPVSYRDGVHIESAEGQSLWCDAERQRELCFFASAAGLSQLRLSDALLCSERSWRLYAELLAASDRVAGKPPSLLLSPPGRPFQLGAARLELFPSGQLPGAAGLWLRTSRGTEIVYAGAPNPTPRTTVEAMQVRAAETLIVHAPLALQDRALPSRDEALRALAAELSAGTAERAICIVLCSALSTAPELVHALRTEPLFASLAPRPPLFAHSQILRVCAAYRRVGALPDHLPADAPTLRRYGGPLPAGGVVLWPLSAGAGTLSSVIKSAPAASPIRVILCSGAALLPGFAGRLSAGLAEKSLHLHTTVPFPDALDRPGLLRYVRDSGCRRVFLTAGCSEELAAALAPIAGFPLGPPSQLRLFD
ncbi:MAG TPA: hypothetical protein PKI03_08785 [Pseudomonadota bacterium]|nr:hypothetical protein [Pseudomonadota bacterium]